jgi:hypothetical protein
VAVAAFSVSVELVTRSTSAAVALRTSSHRGGRSVRGQPRVGAFILIDENSNDT